MRHPKLVRILADVERIKRDKEQERLALGLTVAEYDKMTERDPEVE